MPDAPVKSPKFRRKLMATVTSWLCTVCTISLRIHPLLDSCAYNTSGWKIKHNRRRGEREEAAPDEHGPEHRGVLELEARELDRHNLEVGKVEAPRQGARCPARPGHQVAAEADPRLHVAQRDQAHLGPQWVCRSSTTRTGEHQSGCGTHKIMIDMLWWLESSGVNHAELLRSTWIGTSVVA